MIGLTVAGRRGEAGRFQNGGDFLFLHGFACIIAAAGLAGLCDLVKIHNTSS
jgi:hypothetical protein